jgi:excisionase family DNA binding protein
MNATAVPTIQITDAAKILGVTWKTANKYVHSGQLQAVKVGGRYRTTMEWIEAVAKPVAPHESPKHEAKGGRSKDGEDALRQIEARWGIKVPRP